MTALAVDPETSAPRVFTGMFSQPFEQLRVGDMHTTAGRTVTETDVVMFAHMTGDTLPVHTDRHWAEKEGMYGRRTANGLLTLSYALGLLPLDIVHLIALRRIREVVFKRPVFLGDTIRSRVRITELIDRGAFGCVVVSLQVVNQDDQTVLHGLFELLWKLGGSGTADGG
jgi:acyl dehydratase